MSFQVSQQEKFDVEFFGFAIGFRLRRFGLDWLNVNRLFRPDLGAAVGIRIFSAKQARQTKHGDFQECVHLYEVFFLASNLSKTMLFTATIGNTIGKCALLNASNR